MLGVSSHQQIDQWIGLRDKLQETPTITNIFHRKIMDISDGFDFLLSQSANPFFM